MTAKRTAREWSAIERKGMLFGHKNMTCERLNILGLGEHKIFNVREVLPDEISDTERLDYLIPRINGSVYRNIGVLYSDTSQVREAIDAAIREGKKK